MEHLSLNEIGFGMYYPSTIPDQPLYKALGLKSSCMGANEVCKSVISIPVHPALEQWEVKRIIEVINSWKCHKDLKN